MLKTFLKWIDDWASSPIPGQFDASTCLRMAEIQNEAIDKQVAQIEAEVAFRAKIEVACTRIEYVYSHLIAEQTARAQTSQIKRQAAPPKDRTWEQEQQEAFNALDDSGGL